MEIKYYTAIGQDLLLYKTNHTSKCQELTFSGINLSEIYMSWTKLPGKNLNYTLTLQSIQWLLHLHEQPLNPGDESLKHNPQLEMDREARWHQLPGEEHFLTRQTLDLEASQRRTTKGWDNIVEE